MEAHDYIKYTHAFAYQISTRTVGEYAAELYWLCNNFSKSDISAICDHLPAFWLYFRRVSQELLSSSFENSDIVLRFSDPRRYFQMFLL